MKESTSCAAVGCVPLGVLTGAGGGGRRRRATRSMADHDDADNNPAGRTNGRPESDARPDRYGDRSSAATVGDDRRRRLQEEIEHVQV